VLIAVGVDADVDTFAVVGSRRRVGVLAHFEDGKVEDCCCCGCCSGKVQPLFCYFFSRLEPRTQSRPNINKVPTCVVQQTSCSLVALG
jgi:hypothetical protein